MENKKEIKKMIPTLVPVLEPDQVLVVKVPTHDPNLKGFGEALEFWILNNKKEQVIMVHQDVELHVCKRDQVQLDKNIQLHEIYRCPSCNSINTTFTDNEILIGRANEERLRCLDCKLLFRRPIGSKEWFAVKASDYSKRVGG